MPVVVAHPKKTNTSVLQLTDSDIIHTALRFITVETTARRGTRVMGSREALEYGYEPLSAAVDCEHWVKRINEVLDSSPFRAVRASGEIQQDGQGYRLYLEGVTGQPGRDVFELRPFLEGMIPGCMLRHQQLQYQRAEGRQSLVTRFRTWVLVTDLMEERRGGGQARGTRAMLMWQEWTKGRFHRIDIYLLLLFMLVLAVSVTLLDRHWEDHYRPWDNLIRNFQAAWNGTESG